MSNGMELQLTDVRKHEAVLVKQQEQLDKWCTGGGGEVRADALIRYALAEMSTNQDLRSATPSSVYLALLACGVTGLVPGKLRGYSFLVTFGNTQKDGAGNEIRVQEATFMMGWRGVKHIGFRSGLNLVSQVIHDKDDFDYDKGSARFVRYKPALRAPGPVIGAAAWVELPRNGLEVEFLNMDELAKIKAAATRMRKSPAWDGPFVDQMQRKSALKRLGKQIEMGEEFFKANAIEQADEDTGTIAGALDQLTDGAATRFLGQQSAEAAAFGHLPRPAQAQVPAGAAEVRLTAGGDKPPKKAGQQKPIDARATERPTSGAGSSGSPAPTSNTSPPASAAATPPAPPPAASPTKPASSATSSSPPASAAAPVASSPATSTAAPTLSVVSTPASSPATGAEGTEFPQQSQQQSDGDVAGEPGPDEAFDTSFGGGDDPVDHAPQTPAEWVQAFHDWTATYTTLEDAIANSGWEDIFRGWASSCRSKAELDENKPIFGAWSKSMGFSMGRRGDPSKGIAAVQPSKQVLFMQDTFARRYKEVP